MLKMTNMPISTMPKLSGSSGYNSATAATKKTTQHNEAATVAVASALRCVTDDTDESDEDSESELEIEEDDILLDEADDVVLQIDSEDEAELEAQRIRLDDMKAAAAKSQVSNGKLTTEANQQLPVSRKPRGRPPGSANKKTLNNQRNKIKRKNANNPCATGIASANVGTSAVVIGQIHADEKAQRLIYGCVACPLLYGDSTPLYNHWHNEHLTQMEIVGKRTDRKSPVGDRIKHEPPLELVDGCKLSDFKFCAQLLTQPIDEDQQLHCSFCSATFNLSKGLQLHLGEQHNICKLLVPKEEPRDPMVIIPACDFGLSKSNEMSGQNRVGTLLELPETPPPEKETTEKDDLAMISALVGEITAESSPTVSKMVIKLPVEKRGKRKRKQIDEKMEKQFKNQNKVRVQQEQEVNQFSLGKGKRLRKTQKTAVPVNKNRFNQPEYKKDKLKQDKVEKEKEQENIDQNQVKNNVNEQKDDQMRKRTTQPQPEIKDEPGPKRARKARSFVDYVVDVKDEEDELDEDKDTDSEADVEGSTLHNSSDDSKTVGSIKRELSQEAKRIGTVHTCNFCNKTFQRFSRLQDHLRLHTGEKPHVCGQCGRAFRLKMRLAEHQLRHRTEKAYKCELCALPLATKQDMSLHMRHHKNDRRYKCDCCGKGFVRSSDLAIHVRVHTGEKPYSCDICGKAFRARQNLVVHRRTHLGDKPIQCEMCEKRFSRKIDMRVHMRRHTGEKPFTCSACQRGYSSRVNLQRHQQREHGDKRTRLLPEEPKSQSVTRRPRREKLQEKIAAQEKLLNELKRSLSTLGDIAEESAATPVHKLAEFAADSDAGVGHAQVSVTVKMQVEPAKTDDDEEIIPEKENALNSGSAVSAVSNGKSKSTRKINSYFTVVGQQAEI